MAGPVFLSCSFVLFPCQERRQHRAHAKPRCKLQIAARLGRGEAGKSHRRSGRVAADGETKETKGIGRRKEPRHALALFSWPQYRRFSLDQGQHRPPFSVFCRVYSARAGRRPWQRAHPHAWPPVSHCKTVMSVRHLLVRLPITGEFSPMTSSRSALCLFLAAVGFRSLGLPMPSFGGPAVARPSGGACPTCRIAYGHRTIRLLVRRDG